MLRNLTINFFDTSALLGGYQLEEHKNIINIISNTVFKELEHIKISQNKDEQIKYKARSLIRYLMRHQTIWQPNYPDRRKIERLLAKSHKLEDNNDGLLICEAYLLAKQYHCNLGVPEDTNPCNFHFITADASQYLLAYGFHTILQAEYYKETINKENLWRGYQEFTLGENELSNFYEHPNENTLHLTTNEYALLKFNDEIVDWVKWTGTNNEVIKYKTIHSDFFGKVSPRNDQQKLYFDLLQNPNIRLKLIRGQFGSGKTFLALVHAMSYIDWHKFDKLVFVRNNIEVAGTQRLGALPGEQADKLMPFIAPLADHLGDESVLRSKIEEGIIEPVHLGFLRGRSFKNAIILVDEAENLTTDNIKLIVARCGPGSELWLLGDESQTDSDIFRKNSGIASLINSLKGEPLFGTVELQKCERDEVAALSAKIK